MKNSKYYKWCERHIKLLKTIAFIIGGLIGASLAVLFYYLGLI